jgi:site-specific DNA-methyltransferase (adenine-specific)
MKINEIYNENCLDTMSKLADNFIDLTVTSPPYDGLRTYNGYSFDFENVAKELFRVTKQGGVVVWVVGDATVKGSETGTSFRQALFFIECGFRLHDTMIWEKKNPIPNDPRQNRYIQATEYMFVFSKDAPKTCNYITEPCLMAGIDAGTGTARKQNGDVRIDRKEKRKGKVVKDLKPLTNVWRYSNGTICKEHPASYPEQLANDHIVSWSNENDLVYDSFMGSGTTAKMAHLQKRNWIGSEISAEYVEIANKRLQPYLNQTTLF